MVRSDGFSIFPESADCSPVIILSKVVLPAPLLPTSPILSFCLIRKEMLLKSARSAKLRHMLFKEIIFNKPLLPDDKKIET